MIKLALHFIELKVWDKFIKFRHVLDLCHKLRSCRWLSIWVLTDYHFLCSGNEHIIVYACDCSSETLEKAEEIIAAATVASVGHRFHTFCCDFSTTGFPEWLGCHTCQEIFLQKQQNCLSGFDLHPSHCCVLFVVRMCNMYLRFLFCFSRC